MAIFISYSHKDKDFVDKLARDLVINKARVWIDRWELKVGDSLIQKIQSAIAESNAILVVLSKSSIVSEWGKKELSAGLMRELEEKKVLVLPLLIEDCNIPIFLKEKLYADFRSSYDKGLQQTLEAIAKVTSDSLGRFTGPEYINDWALDWGIQDGHIVLRVTSVSFAPEMAYTVLTTIEIEGNDSATKRYLTLDEKDLDWFARVTILNFCSELVDDKKVFFVLDDNFPKTISIELKDSKKSSSYRVQVVCRRLGEDTGKDIFFDYRGLLSNIQETFNSRLRELTPGEIKFILSSRD